MTICEGVISVSWQPSTKALLPNLGAADGREGRVVPGGILPGDSISINIDAFNMWDGMPNEAEIRAAVR